MCLKKKIYIYIYNVSELVLQFSTCKISLANTCTSVHVQWHYLPTSLQANPMKSGTENSLASLSPLPLSTYNGIVI